MVILASSKRLASLGTTASGNTMMRPENDSKWEMSPTNFEPPGQLTEQTSLQGNTAAVHEEYLPRPISRRRTRMSRIPDRLLVTPQSILAV
ncbi:hypothetical protein K474DRAFT_701645 [Panus rudis PR-1116 ss-1]|nr:hypothetical protein K474DRAFT_701645 [Panus rudis PR-1116 ss-1]